MQALDSDAEPQHHLQRTCNSYAHTSLRCCCHCLDGSTELPGEPACPSAAGLLAALPGSPPTLEGDPGADLGPEGALGVSGM